MKRLTLSTMACVLAALAVLVAQTRAQEPDTLDRAFLTFSTAVELPGVVLEPGTYEFKLADNQKRNVVQVFRRSDQQAMGQFTFVQAERERASDETVVTFREAREGTTPAIQYWYSPSEKVGKEFIYPKDQAQRIATRTGQTVRSEDGPVTASTAASAQAGSATASTQPADAQRNAPAAAQPTAAAGSTAGNRGVDAQNSSSADASASAGASTTPAETQRTAPAAAQPTAAAGSTAGNRGAASTQPAPDSSRASIDNNPARPAADSSAASERPVGTSGIAQQADTSAAQPQSSGQTARNELPRTASPLPLSALIGLLSLAGAVGLRMLRA